MRRLISSQFLVALLGSTLAVGCSSSDGDDTPDGGGSTADQGSTTADQGGAAVAPLTEQQLIDGCVRATACGVKRYPSLANCIDSYRDLYVRQGQGAAFDAIYHCVNATGGDCDKVRACFGAGEACDKRFQARCEDTVAFSCDLIDKRVYAIDCAPAKLKCGIKSDQAFTAFCTRGACDTSFRDKCSGDLQQTCAASVIEVRDCAVDGLTCVTTEDAAGCAGNQETTCRGGAVSPFCEGDVAVSCEFVRVHRQDCAAEGGKCVDGECVGQAQLCDETKLNRCAGDKLEACVGDAWVTIDCAALGLGPCATQPDAEWAACGAP